jgi:hypothetical protein
VAEDAGEVRTPDVVHIFCCNGFVLKCLQKKLLACSVERDGELFEPWQWCVRYAKVLPLELTSSIGLAGLGIQWNKSVQEAP